MVASTCYLSIMAYFATFEKQDLEDDLKVQDSINRVRRRDKGEMECINIMNPS